MAVRLSGMFSGMDTDSLVAELVKAKRKNVDKLTKKKTSLEWKVDAWKELNTKIKSFYSSSLSNLRFASSFSTKKTTVSNTAAASVITGDKAMNTVQTLSINKMAKSGYLTGAVMTSGTSDAVTSDSLVSSLSGMKDVLGADGTGSFSISTGGKTTSIEINTDTKISDVLSQIRSAGVNANFDENNKRFFIASSTSGSSADFALTANDENGFKALTALGINVSANAVDSNGNKQNSKTLEEYTSRKMLGDELNSLLVKNGDEVDYAETMTKIDVNSDLYKAITAVAGEDADYEKGIKDVLAKAKMADYALADENASKYSTGAIKIAGQDAEIELNGAIYTNSTNSIEVNGLTITCLSVAKDITVTTQDDTDGIYDMLKNFVSEYNKLVKEFDTLYNADSAAKYEPLTDEEKEAMSDAEVEKWEKKIKDSLLRRDESLNSVSSAMKDIMMQGFTVGDKTMYLSDFGIGRGDYLSAPTGEKSILHIDGDSTDSTTAGNADKLKSMIANDPSTVISFFTQLSRSLYAKMTDLSSSTDYSSSGSFYNDKQMKSDVASYTSKISQAEEKLGAYEDKYYKKFAKMETAMSKLQSSTNALTSMLGLGN